MKKNYYEAPATEILEVKIEKGFAASTGGNIGDGSMTETEGGWADNLN